MGGFSSEQGIKKYTEQLAAIGQQTASAAAAARPPAADPNKLQQFTNFPSWMPQQANTSAYTRVQGMLPSLFNAAPLRKAYGNMDDRMLSSAKASSAAAGRAYASRALQSGGSGQGSGYATGAAMLPYYNQQASNRFDLEKLIAGMHGQRASLETGIAGGITDAGQNNERLLAQYAQGQQGLAQGQDQFALERQKFGESQRQFDVNRSDRSAAMDAAESSASSSGSGKGGGTWGELVTMMIASNSHDPQAAQYWQGMATAARNAGLMDSKVGVSIGGSIPSSGRSTASRSAAGGAPSPDHVWVSDQDYQNLYNSHGMASPGGGWMGGGGDAWRNQQSQLRAA